MLIKVLESELMLVQTGRPRLPLSQQESELALLCFIAEYLKQLDHKQCTSEEVYSLLTTVHYPAMIWISSKYQQILSTLQGGVLIT